MMSLRFCALAAATALLPYASSATDQKPLGERPSKSSGNPFTEDIAEYVHKLLDVYHVPGVAFGVVDGEEIYTEGFGFATLPDTPATPDTIWYGASTSKAQAAAALSQIIASKNYTERLPQGWSTPISSIIRDDFVLADDWATAHITLDDAASHRTGLGRHDLASPDYVDGRVAKPKDVVRNMRNLRMVNEPRVKFLYCNFMFVTISHVIESLTGQWLGDVLRERIWGPLGMDSTYLDLKEALDAPAHFADGYAWNPKGDNFERVEYMNVTSISGAGGVLSSVNDYAKWARCLLNGAAPLDEEVHADIRTPRSIMNPKPNDGADVSLYGAGWMRTNLHGRFLYHHSGGMHAYGAEVFWLPEVKFAVVSFGNTAITSNAVQEIVIRRLIEDRLGIPAEDRFDLDKVRRKEMDQGRKTREKALKKLFPDLPEKTLPSSFDHEQLAGLYEAPGYGQLPLRVAEQSDTETGKKLLIADRSQMTFADSIAFEHITGDYWMASTNLGKSEFMTEYVAAKIVAGVDGKPKAWEMQMSPSADDDGDGLLVWNRVE